MQWACQHSKAVLKICLFKSDTGDKAGFESASMSAVQTYQRDQQAGANDVLARTRKRCNKAWRIRPLIAIGIYLGSYNDIKLILTAGCIVVS